jgi:hypothetical protein
MHCWYLFLTAESQGKTHAERAVGVVHAATDDLAVVNKHAANGNLLGAQRGFGHLQRSTHELVMDFHVFGRSEGRGFGRGFFLSHDYGRCYATLYRWFGCWW